MLIMPPDHLELPAQNRFFEAWPSASANAHANARANPPPNAPAYDPPSAACLSDDDRGDGSRNERLSSCSSATGGKETRDLARGQVYVDAAHSEAGGGEQLPLHALDGALDALRQRDDVISELRATVAGLRLKASKQESGPGLARFVTVLHTST